MHQPTYPEVNQWNVLQRIAFRFFFTLCIVTIVPIISNLLWQYPIEWAGQYFFNEHVTSHPSGSGDTLYDFYDITIKLIVSVIVTLIWSILDRKRLSYNTLLYWQEVYVRYYLAFFFIIYGFMKVIKLQFGHPGLSQLLIPLGNKSPMGLAWTFIGFSDTYTIFSGVCEVLAAVFLIYRKTRTLGALFGFGVMLNVFLMNMSYDIPVKLFSLQLVLLSLFLLLLDYKRLLNVFILNKAVFPQRSQPPFRHKWANLTTRVVKGIAIVGGIGLTVFNNLQSRELYGDLAAKPAMYGIYEVEELIRNNDTIAPNLNDTTYWRYLVLDKYNASVFGMKTSNYDDLTYYLYKTDTIKKEIAFLQYNDSTEVGRLKYAKVNKNHIVFEGKVKGSNLKLYTVKKTEKDFPLMSRGFHWVNEYPYNR